jgi:hypothetical protein
MASRYFGMGDLVGVNRSTDGSGGFCGCFGCLGFFLQIDRVPHAWASRSSVYGYLVEDCLFMAARWVGNIPELLSAFLAWISLCNRLGYERPIPHPSTDTNIHSDTQAEPRKLSSLTLYIDLWQEGTSPCAIQHTASQGGTTKPYPPTTSYLTTMITQKIL